MFLFYEFAFGQYSQVFGYCLARRVKMFGKRVWRHCLQGKQSYNCSSCRVGDGLENISSHFCQVSYETDWLQVYAQLFGFASSFFTNVISQSQSISESVDEVAKLIVEVRIAFPLAVALP